MLPANGLLKLSELIAGIGVGATAGVDLSIVATGPAVDSDLGADSIFGPGVFEPVPQPPVEGPKGEIEGVDGVDGADGAGFAAAGARGRAGAADAREGIAAAPRPPTPLAAPLNNSSSGSSRCA